MTQFSNAAVVTSIMKTSIPRQKKVKDEHSARIKKAGVALTLASFMQKKESERL
jgi:hypothetical protein